MMTPSNPKPIFEYAYSVNGSEDSGV